MPRKKRAVFIINSLTVGGAERVMCTFLGSSASESGEFEISLVLLDIEESPIDARILKGIREGTARLIDSEGQVGGWPAIEAVSGRAALPLDHARIDDAKALQVLTPWLCEQSKQAGGDKNACE